MDNHIFRSAALGFNRQDVMEYIEKVQKEAEAKASQLTGQLDTACQEGEATRQSLDECAQERDRLSEELEALKEQYEQEKAAWDASAQETVRQEERLRTLEEENERLTGQVRELESRMADLRRDKERLTQLELDAHHRSDELIAQAQAQAEEIIAEATARGTDIRAQAQTQADDLLKETRRQISASVEKCGELLRSCETVAAHVSGELRKMDVAVAQLPVGMDHLKNGLAELLKPAEER